MQTRSFQRGRGDMKKTNLSDEIVDKSLRQKVPEPGQSEQGDPRTGRGWSVCI